MKVQATHWVNVEGIWREAGEIFEVESAAGLPSSIKVIAEPESKPAEKPAEEPKAEPEKPAPKRRNRK